MPESVNICINISVNEVYELMVWVISIQ